MIVPPALPWLMLIVPPAVSPEIMAVSYTGVLLARSVWVMEMLPPAVDRLTVAESPAPLPCMTVMLEKPMFGGNGRLRGGAGVEVVTPAIVVTSPAPLPCEVDTPLGTIVTP